MGPAAVTLQPPPEGAHQECGPGAGVQGLPLRLCCLQALHIPQAWRNSGTHTVFV